MSNKSTTTPTTAPATPAPATLTESSDSNKRELSSPFDPNDLKKARSLSVDSDHSELDTSTTRVHLCDEDLAKISSLLVTTFENKISTMVSSITKGVIQGLNERIKDLECENSSLKEKIVDMENKLEQVEETQDKANQYSRRNCLRLSGFKETAEENTDLVILDVARAIGADIALEEIDRSHRLGPIRTTGPSGGKARPRDIIVKFVSFRSRSKLFKNKSQLQKTPFKGIFINEDLTRSRSDLFYQCRLLAKNNRIKSTWTSDGAILVKDQRDHVHRFETKRQFADMKVKTGISF